MISYRGTVIKHARGREWLVGDVSGVLCLEERGGIVYSSRAHTVHVMPCPKQYGGARRGENT